MNDPLNARNDGKVLRTDRMLGAIAISPARFPHLFARTCWLPAFAA
jgi:hypothetical protein